MTMGKNLDTLFDGYKQNSGKVSRIEEKYIVVQKIISKVTILVAFLLV
ncbi:hypothetical protein [Dethiothermospora halolimnae]